MPSLLPRPLLILPRLLTRPLSISTTPILRAEGDTGSLRRGGEAHADTWTRREKAAEDMYIKEREKSIMQLLKEKIAAQEALLERDRAMLAVMEDQYGHVVEEKEGW